MRRRIPMELRLERPCVDSSHAARPVTEADKDSLAGLLRAAYRGTIDDEGETFADALEEIEKTFRGGYGRFLPNASFALEENGEVVSASLVTWFEPHGAPLLAFLMTKPEVQRRGLARALLRSSIFALLDAGYDRLTLVVTDGNCAAQVLYESLGFRPVV